MDEGLVGQFQTDLLVCPARWVIILPQQAGQMQNHQNSNEASGTAVSMSDSYGARYIGGICTVVQISRSILLFPVYLSLSSLSPSFIFSPPLQQYNCMQVKYLFQISVHTL